jgi:hypothetical protein
VSKPARERAAPREVVIPFSLAELRTLDRLAHYYQRSMGPMRHIVRFTAAAEVRAKYRFIAEESRWLQKFIESAVAESDTGEGEIPIEFASRAVIAFWGRVLSNLHSKRARRRMKAEDVAMREVLAEKLSAAARELEVRWPGSLESDLATRRRDEASWMRENLGEDYSATRSHQSGGTTSR